MADSFSDKIAGQSARLGGVIARAWTSVWGAIADPGTITQAQSDKIASQARETAPIVWLLGKVQSGKTSIVRALTNASDAEIGTGFKACTRTARVFDFPREAPVIRFLDTRGLGEAAYDPADDIAFCQQQAHLLLVVMKALDPQQAAILAVVREARRRHPGWPIVVAQSSLHEGYVPGAHHAVPYPYSAGPGATPAPDGALSADLMRSLAHQRSLFEDLPGTGQIAFVPIDFTLANDGFAPQYYGLESLLAALQTAAPAGLVSSLQEAQTAVNDARSARAHPHIMGYASAAAAADLVPAAGLIAVPAIQAKLLHSLALIYGVDWDRRTMVEFGGCLGAGTLTKVFASLGLRELGKLVPVYGQTVGAAAAAVTSFATTYALGKAACVFLGRRRPGADAQAEVAKAYAEAFSKAFGLAKERHVGQPSGAGAAP